jgi:acyl-CoA thioesterase-1
MTAQVTYGALRRCSKALALLLCIAAGPLRADQVDILALGDSLTAGYGLMDQDGFVPQLTAWLAANGHPARVVNAGVSGDTTAGGLARFEWSLDGTIDAVIVALGGNDLLRGIDPAVARANLAAILDIAKARNLPVLLIGLGAPGNYGPDYKAAFDAIWPDLSAQYGTLMVPSFFVGFEGRDPTRMGDLMQPDGIHPNEQGVAAIVAGLGPHVIRLIETVTPKG